MEYVVSCCKWLVKIKTSCILAGDFVVRSKADKTHNQEPFDTAKTVPTIRHYYLLYVDGGFILFNTTQDLITRSRQTGPIRFRKYVIVSCACGGYNTAGITSDLGTRVLDIDTTPPVSSLSDS